MRSDNTKKIPTLFERTYENHKVKSITDKITPGMEEVLERGIATVKWDGSCCAVMCGDLYKRYDAKNGKKPPEGAIPCCDPDPITGHWPHWIKVDESQPDSKWHLEAWRRIGGDLEDGTYEIIGPHFQGNPYGLDVDFFMRHGDVIILNLERSFDGIRSYLEREKIEGIVFWLDGEPKCKIKRSDFGFEWPVEKKVE